MKVAAPARTPVVSKGQQKKKALGVAPAAAAAKPRTVAHATGERSIARQSTFFRTLRGGPTSGRVQDSVVQLMPHVINGVYALLLAAAAAQTPRVVAGSVAELRVDQEGVRRAAAALHLV